MTGTAESFARAMAADRRKWADVVKTAGIEVQR
jgi:hypothetical protein